MHKAYNVDTLSVKFALRNFYEMFYTLMSDPLWSTCSLASYMQ